MWSDITAGRKIFVRSGSLVRMLMIFHGKEKVYGSIP
jgi:hypothetical protein